MLLPRRALQHLTSVHLGRTGSCSLRSLSTLGIRREDAKRIWERRTPLTPDDLAKLLAVSGSSIKAEVESCSRRCFSDSDYVQAGANIVPRLSPAVDLILGVKEPPVDEVLALQQALPGKKRTYMVFSHTHKGQPHNYNLLSAFLGHNWKSSLIDYELLTAPTLDKNVVTSLKRVAAFGWYAGAVGAGEALCMTGLALLRRGVATPLLHLPRPYMFGNLAAYKAGLQDISSLMPTSPSSPVGPLVIGLTGAGNVATGAKEMLDAFGVQWVKPDQLPSLPNDRRASVSAELHTTKFIKLTVRQVYACEILPPDYLIRSGGGPYDRTEYRRDPSSYRSVFAERIAPHLTSLINGAGWQAGCPRLLSTAQMRELGASGTSKLVAVQDVVCDLNGGIEFVDRGTTIDDPYFVGPGGVVVSSTDILPTELPIDASRHFSAKILPYVQYLVARSKASIRDSNMVSTPDLSAIIDRATIVKDGNLTAPHRWLEQRLSNVSMGDQDSRSPLSLQSGLPRREPSELQQTPYRPTASRRIKHKVLLLGSGLVAGPAVEVFSDRRDVSLSIASNNLAEAECLAGMQSTANIEAVALNVADPKALEEAVAHADVVVSLLPAPMHVAVAKQCILHGKHLVTASYISPEMKSLHQAAEDANVVLLGECGLDPGIDSMAAMRILDRVKREAKTVTSFVSWCGGLPEPSASNVPLGYKFSWSPKAVLTAALNDARYKLDGEIVNIAGEDLLQRHFPKVELWKGLALEGLANRDAIPYAEKYGLGEVHGLTNLFRGTLSSVGFPQISSSLYSKGPKSKLIRYQGFSRLLDSFRQIGLLGSDRLPRGTSTWPDVLLHCLSTRVGVSRKLMPSETTAAIRDLLGEEQASEAIQALTDLSSLSQRNGTDDLHIGQSQSMSTPIDVFALMLSQRLAYRAGERDTCLLHHAFEVVPAGRGSRPPPRTGEQEVGGRDDLPSHTHDYGTPSTQRITASLMHYGTPRASSMATTVGKTLAFAALRVLDGQVRIRGVCGPYEREVWEGVLDLLEDVGVKVKEDGWN